MGINLLKIQRKSYKRDKSHSISNESSTVGSASNRKERGTRSHKNLMKAHLVYQNVRNATWIVKGHLAVISIVKWARRGYYHIEILLSSHGVGQKNLEGLLWG